LTERGRKKSRLQEDETGYLVRNISSPHFRVAMMLQKRLKSEDADSHGDARRREQRIHLRRGTKGISEQEKKSERDLYGQSRIWACRDHHGQNPLAGGGHRSRVEGASLAPEE
jgi:hypothetical protein